VNIYCSSKWKKRASTNSCGSCKDFSRKLPSLKTLLYCTVLLSVVLLMISGCGRKELEDAKQQINNLTAENQKLTELTASLNKDKNQLNEQIKTLKDKNSSLQRDLDDVNRTRATLTDENKKSKDKIGMMEEELARLHKEQASHAEEIEEYKKRLAESTSMSKPSVPVPGPMRAGEKSEENLSPCDATIAFMKASEPIIKQQKGNERTKALEELKKQFAPRMQKAPAKAVKAAEDWVKQAATFWDKSPDDAVYRLLQLRNAVLDACGKSPDTAGFK